MAGELMLWGIMAAHVKLHNFATVTTVVDLEGGPGKPSPDYSRCCIRRMILSGGGGRWLCGWGRGRVGVDEW